MKTYLLKQEQRMTNILSIYKNVEPFQLGVSLVTYFNTEKQVSKLFSKEKRIESIKNNKIHYLSQDKIKDLYRKGTLDIFNDSKYSNTSIKDYLEFLCSGILTMKFLYIYDKKWTCYTGYQAGKKRILEEIHLENLQSF